MSRNSPAAPKPSYTAFRGVLAALAALCFPAARAVANPEGMTVVSGNVSAQQSGANLNITASQNAVINWASFNIAAGETTSFIQPNNISVVWNRITDQNPSQIWGHLNGNGIVVLMNQSGFYFGPNSSVNCGGFVAASAMVTPPASVGGLWSYQGPPPVASIINYGEIKVAEGGSLFLVAEKIENHGLLMAPDGTLGLYAGKQVLLSERPDGRGLSANVALPDGSIDNVGKISADAGTIALHARTVNQDGVIAANSIRERNGVIELIADEAVNLGEHSLITANGDVVGSSAGGEITVKSGNTLTDTVGSRIEVRGGAQGGNGGAVELSAATIEGDLHSRVDGTAQTGWRGGKMLLDPTDVTLTASSLAPYVGMSTILIEATHNISLTTGTVLDLNGATGVSDAGSVFSLQAGNDIRFGNNSRIFSSAGWAVNLNAGGNIYLNGGSGSTFNGAIETFDGSLTLSAGHNVLLGNGYIRTTGGGNILITTGDGDVDAGLKKDTYDYTRTGYVIASAGLGGIGTAAGGNVTINSGRDILSTTANIGAFGASVGNVNLTAARDIKGKFMLRNGVGIVHALRDLGTGSSGGSFGLVGGGWDITADRDLFVNEVYNPNGSLNNNSMVVPQADYPGNISTTGVITPPTVRSTFLFDYAHDAYVHLHGGNSVSLLGNNLAKTSSNPARPPIYAPILEITAGAGGVTLGNDVILAPSAFGYLSISTPGSLRSADGKFCQLTISDSGLPAYGTFSGGHAVTPVHAGQLGSIMTLNIGGNLQNVQLNSAGSADIRVHGNAINASFLGQNVAPGGTTRFLVDGDFTSRSDRTSIVLSDDAAAAFEHIFLDETFADNLALAAKLSYDAVTHTLTYQGIMTSSDLAFLVNPTVYVWDPRNGYQLDDFGNKVTTSATFTTDLAALSQLYSATQDIPTSPLARNGIQIGGPGSFNFTAHNLDLGISSGIRSVGTLNNAALAAISPVGVDMNLALAGNLDMTSSQIASYNGGSISIFAGGSMNIGSQSSYTSDDTPKGIYTGHGGSVSVHAVGSVLVNGSRIASYDGGDVSVISDTGDVDAGSGRNGFFRVTTSELNPLTGQIEIINTPFFGSGVMAFTRNNSAASVGNLYVHAGRDILGGSSGYLQIPFNDSPHAGRTLTLDAGRDILVESSGVLGVNVNLNAVGKITGKIVGSDTVDLKAEKLSVTALGPLVSASGDSSASTLIGVSVNTSDTGGGGGPDVITTGGEGGGSALANVAAPAATKTVESADKAIAAADAGKEDEEEQKKKRGEGGGGPVLAQKTSRVTVILPEKNKS